MGFCTLGNLSPRVGHVLAQVDLRCIREPSAEPSWRSAIEPRGPSNMQHATNLKPLRKKDLERLL
ncbi:hypothetical protein Pla22_13970 [Rubripirellula amarantea]|uniref:Uncharacterized protein n=1 Tax=Rubripirellula amarantea TaxID=2527999 RepID=A0A5C5WS73_9BACT|nr:hypothetical protein Pla22_13970 [Rubripirellula amarantea]